MICGIIIARGRGSSLPEKNIYPLNGKPMLEHFVNEVGQCRHLDEIFVWTESEKVADVPRACRCIPLKRSMEMVYYGSGFYKVKSWHNHVMNLIQNKIGQPSVVVNLNCNYVLFRAATLTAMIDRLFEKQSLQQVFAVAPVNPGIFIENSETGLAMPLFPDLTGIIRKLGISVTRIYSSEFKAEHFKVSWEDGRDVQNLEDIPFAEYVLQMRAEKKKILENRS